MTTSLTTTHTQRLRKIHNVLLCHFKLQAGIILVYGYLIILTALCVSYNMVGNMKLYSIFAQGGQQSPHIFLRNTE